jgi:hypothetical protein
MSFRNTPGGCCCFAFDFYGRYDESTPLNNQRLWMTFSIVENGHLASETTVDHLWGITMYPLAPSSNFGLIRRSLPAPITDNEFCWVTRDGNEDHPEANLDTTERITNPLHPELWTLGGDANWDAAENALEITTASATVDCFAQTAISLDNDETFWFYGLINSREFTKAYIRIEDVDGTTDAVAWVDFGTAPPTLSQADGVTNFTAVQSFEGAWEIKFDFNTVTTGTPAFSIGPWTTAGNYSVTATVDDALRIYWATVRKQQDALTGLPDVVLFDVTGEVMVAHYYMPRVLLVLGAVAPSRVISRRGQWNNEYYGGVAGPLGLRVFEHNTYHWLGDRTNPTIQAGDNSLTFYRDGEKNSQSGTAATDTVTRYDAIASQNRFSDLPGHMQEVEFPDYCARWGGNSDPPVVGLANAVDIIPRIVITPPRAHEKAFAVKHSPEKFMSIEVVDFSETFYDSFSVTEVAEVWLGAVDIFAAFTQHYTTFVDGACVNNTRTVRRITASEDILVYQHTKTETRLAQMSDFAGEYAAAGHLETTAHTNGRHAWAHCLWGDAWADRTSVKGWGAIVAWGEKEISIAGPALPWNTGEAGTPPTEAIDSLVTKFRVIVGGTVVKSDTEFFRDDDLGGRALDGNAWARAVTVTPPSAASQIVIGCKVIWFEQLWATEPTALAAGVPGLWRMHCHTDSGADHWYLDADVVDIGFKPAAFDATDEQIYVVGFPLCDDRLSWNDTTGDVPVKQSHHMWVISHRAKSGTPAGGPFKIVPIGKENTSNEGLSGGPLAYWTGRDMAVATWPHLNGKETSCFVNTALVPTPPGPLTLAGFADRESTPEIWEIRTGVNYVFHVHFDELVDDVGVADFDVVVTGTVAGTVTGVAYSPTGPADQNEIYDVTVTSVTGAGTLGLALADAPPRDITSTRTGLAITKVAVRGRNEVFTVT